MGKLTDRLREASRKFCSVVVVAAGTSQRMGRDKLSLDLDGAPVLARTLAALNRCPAVDEIVAVTRREKLGEVGALRAPYSLDKLTKVVVGGDTRTASALAGVRAVSPRARVVCVHDGARPFVTPELVEAVVRTAARYESAAPALPVRDTVKRAVNGVVTETPEREGLFAVQTPQGFRPELLNAALTKALREGRTYTDDCAAVEALGVPTHLTPGDPDNIKITDPADLARAAAILAARKKQETEGAAGA